MSGPETLPRRTHVLDLVVLVLAVAGLGIDAYLHADLASRYDPIMADVSQGTLFRLEAAFAALAALLLIIWRGRLTAAFAFLVAAGGLALLLIYRFHDVGAWGPFPNMYEPVWYDKKVIAVVAQAVAALAALYLFVVGPRIGPRVGPHRDRRPRVV
ncbi:hypothetical protein [Actinacidiphila rubida]|uniref:DoxX family protein n=1 Tax=Actinacidiphila rubida TaxID=310780 RepID=A0A1H8JI56_9ACTN|nr:hypothetical protein [Actinacidiphila rubida]SEN80420.1 hypothetical protein SAMN05216267_1010134 [Actinacidiphila rubida]